MATQRVNRHMEALLPQPSMLCRCAEGPQLYMPAAGPMADRTLGGGRVPWNRSRYRAHCTEVVTGWGEG